MTTRTEKSHPELTRPDRVVVEYGNGGAIVVMTRLQAVQFAADIAARAEEL